MKLLYIKVSNFPYRSILKHKNKVCTATVVKYQCCHFQETENKDIYRTTVSFRFNLVFFDMAAELINLMPQQTMMYVHDIICLLMQNVFCFLKL